MSGWGTWDDWPIEHESQTQTDKVNEFTLNTLYSDEQRLAEALQGVVLSNTQIHKSEEKNGDFFGGGASDGANNGYPLRPYAEDCTFYMKTGTCKFKLACKYNHPVNRANQGAKEKEGFVEQTANIECKYYLTPGGCRFAEACKFRHSLDHKGIKPQELNFLGLPIRMGEKTCPFYMRTGSCSYGEKCKFHHPDPSNLGASETEINVQADSPEKVTDVGGNRDNEPDLLPVFTASQPIVEPWGPHMIMRETALYLGNHSHSLPEAVVSDVKQLSKQWNRYQTPTLSEEETEQTTLNIKVNDSLEKNVSPLYSVCKVQSEKFPEQPGQPECDYYMKTGYCNFGSACRYHHPENRSSRLHIDPLKDRDTNQKSFYALEKIRQNVPAPEGYNLTDKVNTSKYHEQIQFGQFPERPGHPVCSFFMKTGDCKFRSTCRYHHPIDRHSTSCSLNAKGLPLRPGRDVCDHFKQYGICKFGRHCLFDHPEDLGSLNSLKGSNSNILSGSEPATI